MEYTEDFPPSSSDTLTRLCSDWEDSANLPDDCKTRVVKVRIGVVLGRNGGVIQQTIWPYWLGLGGTVWYFHDIFHSMLSKSWVPTFCLAMSDSKSK